RQRPLLDEEGGAVDKVAQGFRPRLEAGERGRQPAPADRLETATETGAVVAAGHELLEARDQRRVIGLAGVVAIDVGGLWQVGASRGLVDIVDVKPGHGLLRGNNLRLYVAPRA